jgi:hypothetical protein
LTRLRDVVEPRISGTKRVLDLSDGGWIAGFLHLPEGMDLVPTRAEELATAIQPDDLVVDAVSVRAGEDGLLASVRTVVSQLVPGATAVLLTRDTAGDLPLDRIERITAFAGCQLLEIAELAYPEWPTAVVVGGGADPRPGEEGTAPVGSAVLVRGSLGGALGRAPAAAADGAVAGVGENQAAQLRAQIDEQQLTIARMRREMKALRSSLGLQVGSALVEAAKSPSAVPRLPVRLVRIWRRRRRGGGKSPGAQQPAVTAARPAELVAVSEDSRLLAWSPEPADRTVLPEIFGIVTDSAAEMLTHHSTLRRLMPHEARLALDRGLPDVVLIQASALLAPSPWGHTGTPGGAVSHARALYDMTVMAGVLGVPVVVWQDIRPSMTPALATQLRRADLVIGDGQTAGAGRPWSPGVSLAAFHPVAKTPTGKVLVVPEVRAVAAGPEARARRELGRAGLAAEHPLWSPTLADAVRTHAVALASPFGGGRPSAVSDLTLASIATGARVLSGPNDNLLGAFPSVVVPVNDPAAVAGAAETVLRMAEPTSAERRLNLRHIFDTEATPVRLGWLAAALGLRSDPLAPRQVTVVIDGADERDTAVAIDDLLSQTHRPARVLITADGVSDRALDEIRALGIDVAVRPRAPWPALAGATDSAWVLMWRTGAAAAPRGLLHDLLAASETVPADVIGAAGSSADASYGRFVESLPIEGSLIRRDVLPQLGSDTDLRVLAERGLRLFAVHEAGSDR